MSTLLKPESKIEDTRSSSVQTNDIEIEVTGTVESHPNLPSESGGDDATDTEANKGGVSVGEIAATNPSDWNIELVEEPDVIRATCGALVFEGTIAEFNKLRI